MGVCVDKLLQAERLDKIRNILVNKGTVYVSRLSQIYEVSENTIRRDLMLLEEEGLCYRTKGGASFLKSSQLVGPFVKRIEKNKEAKKAIAKCASDLVENGMTIILDSGTTCFELAEILRTRSHLTVITNSLASANILSGSPDITLIVSGGILHDQSQSLTGSPAESFFAQFHADIVFLSVKAVSVEFGYSEHTIPESSVKKGMIDAAERIVILADNSKLNKKALCPLAQINSAQLLITDSCADYEFVKNLNESGLAVQMAPVSK